MPLRPKRTKNVVQTGNIADSGASTAKNRIKDWLSYRRPAFWMICAAVAAVAAWIVLPLANPVQTLELPDEEEVMAVEMEQFDDRLTIGRKFITDARQIRDILSAMAGAKNRIATAKELKACYEKAETEGHRKRVLEVRRYLYENWRSIENATKYPDVIGCSAEGHVSHVLSERLSSRPMGWSLTGSEQMSRLRAFIFNGGNLYAALKKTHDNEPGIPRKTVNSIRRRVMKSFENIGNIPVLQMAGRTSRAYLIIRGIQHGSLMY
jgi:hypothetical protein